MNLSKNTLKKIDCIIAESNNINNQIKNLNEIPVDICSFDEYFPFEKFNFIQSNFIKKIHLGKLNNFWITAPTSSGKTVLFELMILYFYNDFNYKKKSIYISPLKALCQEQVENWKNKFKNLNVKELTGDIEINDYNYLNDSNIIIATPEKLDHFLRKWREYEYIINNIGLLMVDEIHCISDEDRGSVLEGVINRLKFLQIIKKNNIISNMHILSASATLPNPKDFSEWLKVKDYNTLIFGEEFRPVKWEINVYGYNKNKNPYLFDVSLNYKWLDIIKIHSDDKPVLIFCNTQKSTNITSNFILENFPTNLLIKNNKQLNNLMNNSRKLTNEKLSHFVKNGIGFHNGSLNQNDRMIVEKLFKSSDIKILCTTSTLSQGVNLPAHLVIIKGTKSYKSFGKGYTEYSKIEIQQMSGRAGRPQFDTKGIVCILTEKEWIDYYENINSSQKKPLESQYKNLIIDNLWNEICLKTVKNMNEAKEFLKESFLMTRIINELDFHKREEILNDYLLDSIGILKDLELIESENEIFIPSIISKKLCSYSIEVKSFKNLKDQEFRDIKSLLQLISESVEFSKFKSKMNERKRLIEINNKILYSLKGSINTHQKKVYVLIQAGLMNINIENWELKKNSDDAISIAFRVLIIFKNYYLINKKANEVIIISKLLQFISSKCFDESNQNIFKQLKGVGNKTSENLVNKNIKIEDIINYTFEELNIKLNKNLNDFIGKKIKESILCINPIKIEIKKLNAKFKNITLEILGEFCEHLDHNNYLLIIKENNLISSHLYFNSLKKRTLQIKNFNSFPIEIYILSEKMIGKNKILLIDEKTETTIKKKVIIEPKAKIIRNTTNKKNIKKFKNDNEKSKKMKIEELKNDKKFKFLKSFFNKN